MSNIDIFKFHKEIMEDYKGFVSSFVNIKDEEIKKRVKEEFDTGKFWPEPLIQFNPAYKEGESIDYLIENNILHPKIADVFTGYKLYKHQVEAIKLGVENKNFIVTSGTGSGKSLTYLATIFDYLFKNKKGNGIKAIIVYPMNALINSQYEEIEKYKSKYEEKNGEFSFPIKFAKYTGQETEDEKDSVKNELPDIILTNYVMLDLLMTRNDEYALRDSVKKDLNFLVFDELHTYNGRQGADVGILIRKIKAQCDNQNIITIGTSATMVSGSKDSKKIIAKFAKKIFGVKFEENQIIEEYLARFFEQKTINKDDLLDCLENIDNLNKENIKSFPLSVWFEENIALKEENNKLLRGKPLRLTQISEKLSKETDLSLENVQDYLKKYLQKISDINKDEGTKYLPYKIHQFISQTGAIKLSLDKSIIILKAENEQDGIPLFTGFFGKTSGGLFLAVYKDIENNRLIPRELDEEDINNLVAGFLILDDNLWPNEEIKEEMPTSWFTKTGNISNKYKDRFPEKIFFNNMGDYFINNPKLNVQSGLFMKAPLLFDIYDGTNTNKGVDRNKLLKLGSEARSTSTTVLSFSILRKLLNIEDDESKRKLLSFTDNRQDAALQTGHFNDFISIVRLRSVIYHTLKREKSIKFSELGNKIFETLNLKQDEYIKSEEELVFSNVADKYKNTLKDFLVYKVIEDLKYGWRLVFPNLEQTGLLKINFEYLIENSEDEKAWKDVPFINILNPQKRVEIIYNLLNYIREEYAINSDVYLSDENIRKKSDEINERLKEPWVLDNDEKIKLPNYVRFESMKVSYKGDDASSIGKQSRVGKYLIKEAEELGLDIKKDYNDFISKFMNILKAAGWLISKKVKNSNRQIELYRVNLDSIIWKIGDNKHYKNPIRDTSIVNNKPKINNFFHDLYVTNFKNNKKFEAREHTGQISKEERMERETKFREGEYNILFCSPTMELGIDISELNIVHMRNVPPTPANYVQRSGRAGRSGQAALVFTNASTYSPHDIHYFNNSIDMVAGKVTEPKIDLMNEEMLKAHLHSVYLSRCRIEELNKSFSNVMELESNNFEVKEIIKDKFKASNIIKEEIKLIFLKIIKDIKSELDEKDWYHDNWIDEAIYNTP